MAESRSLSDADLPLQNEKLQLFVGPSVAWVTFWREALCTCVLDSLSECELHLKPSRQGSHMHSQSKTRNSCAAIPSQCMMQHAAKLSWRAEEFRARLLFADGRTLIQVLVLEQQVCPLFQHSGTGTKVANLSKLPS